MKRRLAMTGALALTGSACTFVRSIGSPIHRVYDQLRPTANVQSLIVFLPGVFDYAEDFERFGFMQAVRQAQLPVDMVAVDANLRYLQYGTLVDRLRQDVVKPARQRGYSRIWLAGISLGGLSAMLYASKDTDISGVIAIAPFLGRVEAIEEVASAGGLEQWQADSNTVMFDWERDPYLWLQRYLNQFLNKQASQTQPRPAPRLIMGLGLQDRYYREQSALASSLPPDDVFVAPGIHDWPVWQTLWRKILSAHGDLLVGH